MLIKVKFKVNSIFGKKGEERLVSERAAAQFLTKNLIETAKDQKEEKLVIETKEEKQVPETKESKPKVKITKSPR